MELFFKEAVELKRDTGLEIPTRRIEMAKSKTGDAKTRDFERLKERLNV